MAVRLIHNGQEYREARQTLLDLVGLDPASGSPDGNRLVALVQLIEQYEAPFMQELRCLSRLRISANVTDSTGLGVTRYRL
jgi:hypothetical protein